MRILYIHQFFATRESELGLIRSYEFSRRWVEQGHEVTVITSSSRLPEEFSAKQDRRRRDRRYRRAELRARRLHQLHGYARRIWSFLAFMFGATLARCDRGSA